MSPYIIYSPNMSGCQELFLKIFGQDQERGSVTTILRIRSAWGQDSGIFVLDLSWIRSAPGNFSILKNRNPWGSDLGDFCLGLSIQHPGPRLQNYNTWTMDLGSCIRDF
jgi:hypothetical protein